MKKPDNRNVEYHKQRTRDQQIIKAYSAWIDSLITEQFWQGWLVNFMFEEMHLSEAGTKAAMQQEVIGFVKKLNSRFHRKPLSAAAYQVIPRLIGCPDYPVFKRDKEGARLSTPNQGRHFNAVLVHPLAVHTRACRLKVPLDQHVEDNKQTYYNKNSTIDRIHFERIVRSPREAAEYTLKALNNDRISLDDILILPKAILELRG